MRAPLTVAALLDAAAHAAAASFGAYSDAQHVAREALRAGLSELDGAIAAQEQRAQAAQALLDRLDLGAVIRAELHAHLIPKELR